MNEGFDLSKALSDSKLNDVEADKLNNSISHLMSIHKENIHLNSLIRRYVYNLYFGSLSLKVSVLDTINEIENATVADAVRCYYVMSKYSSASSALRSEILTSFDVLNNDVLVDSNVARFFEVYKCSDNLKFIISNYLKLIMLNPTEDNIIFHLNTMVVGVESYALFKLKCCLFKLVKFLNK